MTPVMADTSTLIVHYQRDDGAYADWNLWVWADDGEGEAYDFTETDDYGVVAIINLPEGTSQAGFIVRTNDWDKDISEDRFIEINDGFAEVWLRTGEAEVLTEAPDNFSPFDANGSTEKDIDKETTNDEVATVVAEGDIVLRVHYHRFASDYDGWNLWLWPEGCDGAAYYFTGEDDFGQVAEVTIPNPGEASRVGIIVRLNEWEAKDVDKDRFFTTSTTNADGSIDVYLVQSNEMIYKAKDDVDLSPKFLSASINQMDQVEINVTIPFNKDDALNLFKLQDSTGKEINITNIYADGSGTISNCVLFLEEALSLDEKYSVVSDTYGEIALSMNKVFDLDAFEDAYFYDGDDLGAIYSADETAFRVWAPTASEVSLMLYTDGHTDSLIKEIPMTTGVNGTWVSTETGDLNGVYFTYKVLVDGITNESVDPYAMAVGVNGDRGMVIDLDSTDPANWENDKAPELADVMDTIVYELHVRDLSTDEDAGIENVGKFLGLTETGTVNGDGLSTGLDHIKDLGVTHVQLLPVFDYRSINETSLDENNFNWGYDPENYNAPEGSYSTDPYNGEVRIKEFKTMIQTLHDNDLRVIMDVVYNHTGASGDSHLNKIVPGYYYRTFGDSWANGSGCGNETASERAMVQKMMVESVVHWVEEYHIDGFRFDLMGLHDQETMQMIRAAVDAIDPSIIIYGEGWTGGASPLPDEEKCLKVNTVYLEGIGAFSDDMRDGVKGHVFSDEAQGFVNGATDMVDSVMFGIVAATANKQIRYSAVNYSNSFWAISPEQSINYVEAHDNLTLWDKLEKTNPDSSVEDRIMMDKMSAAIVLTSQGVPFLHAGQEFLRTKEGDHNSYQSPDSVNKLDWSRKTEYIDVFDYYQGLIDLRQAHPAFKMTTTSDIQDNLFFYGQEGPLLNETHNTIAYLITNNANGDSAGTIFVAFNPTAEDLVLDIPSDTWDVLLTGDYAGAEAVDTVTGNTVTIPALTSLVMATETVYNSDNDYGMVETANTETTEEDSDTEEVEKTDETDTEEADETDDDGGMPVAVPIAAVIAAGGLGGFFYSKKKKAK